MKMSVISTLVEHGWIPLRQLGILLDSPDRSIYGRQRSKNPVDTIRIGGTERVYFKTVCIELLAAEEIILLDILRTAIRDKERKDAKSLRTTERGS